MRVAFYAPLKSPFHSRPSGDRLMARLLISAIAGTGRDVELATEFRSWDGAGDRARQLRLRDVGRRCARRLLRRYDSGRPLPDVWFTYHVYQKAPDWIGPLVCDALDIPYVIAEASHAPKQAHGPWHIGHEQCRLCIRRADAVVNLNHDDIPCLRSLVGPGCRLVELKPFIPMATIERSHAARRRIARTHGIPADVPWLVCVAMMRCGDKLESFAALAGVLGSLERRRWQLIVVGDGEARARVEALFAPFSGRVTLTGLLGREAIYPILKSSDIYVWPAVNEAYGMALLEAQSCGLPVVAISSGGVPQIVEHGRTGLLAGADDPDAMARYLGWLIDQPTLRQHLGRNARDKSHREHDIAGAIEVLDNVLGALKT